MTLHQIISWIVALGLGFGASVLFLLALCWAFDVSLKDY